MSAFTILILLSRLRPLLLLGRAAAPPAAVAAWSLSSLAACVPMALVMVSARFSGWLVTRPVLLFGWLVARYPEVPLVESFAPRVGLSDLPTFPGWLVWLTDSARFDFSGFSLAAPREVRHSRDFKGPADFVALQERFETRLLLWLLLAFFLVYVPLRLGYVHVKSSSDRWSLWVDLPDQLAPGPALRFDREVNANFVGVGPGGGVGYQTITSAVVAQRLRRRARWVRALEGVLGGRRGVVATYLRGRWTPDLPSEARSDVSNYCLATIPDGARCLGGGIIYGEGANPEPNVYLVLDIGGDAEVIFPDLLGKLRQYALFRKRDELLLGTLRTRALEWCKAQRFRSWVSDLAVAAAVGLAMTPSAHEQLASARVARACGSPLLPLSLD